MFLLSIGPPGLDSSGYGEMQRRILLSLDKLGWQITLRPFKSLNAKIEDQANEKQLCSMEKRPLPPVGSPLLFFSPAPMFCPNPQYYNIGYTMTEVDSINQQWVDNCNSMDEVWVPSRFNYETFINCGVKREKLSIIPLGVDVKHFKPATTSKEGLFTFFSCVELVPRKACDILLEAYCKEFSIGEPVRLIIKAFKNGGSFDLNGSTLTSLLKKIKNKYSNSAPVYMEKRILPYDKMPLLYQQSDCYVSSSRGEGWNLPAMEAMACGIPVIAYNWSGHTEFLNKENSFLIPAKNLEPAGDGLYSGTRWVKVDKESISKMMRYVFSNKGKVRSKGLLARDHTKKLHSLEIVAQNISQHLIEINKG